MRKIVVVEWMSLDGVVQAPAYSDEDTSGGFKHGGWHLPYFDERSMKWVVDNVSGAGGFLFGRRTYDVFAAHWPKAPEEEQALARPLNALPKYVASRTLKEPLAWQNSTLLGQQPAPEQRRPASHALAGHGTNVAQSYHDAMLKRHMPSHQGVNMASRSRARPSVPPTPLEKTPIERMTDLALRIIRGPKSEVIKPKPKKRKRRRIH